MPFCPRGARPGSAQPVSGARVAALGARDGLLPAWAEGPRLLPARSGAHAQGQWGRPLPKGVSGLLRGGKQTPSETPGPATSLPPGATCSVTCPAPWSARQGGVWAPCEWPQRVLSSEQQRVSLSQGWGVSPRRSQPASGCTRHAPRPRQVLVLPLSYRVSIT